MPATESIQKEQTAEPSNVRPSAADMELVPPEVRLSPPAAREGEPPPPVLGFSRFYSATGAFTWAPCSVLQYDRWAAVQHDCVPTTSVCRS